MFGLDADAHDLRLLAAKNSPRFDQDRTMSGAAQSIFEQLSLDLTIR